MFAIRACSFQPVRTTRSLSIAATKATSNIFVRFLCRVLLKHVQLIILMGKSFSVTIMDVLQLLASKELIKQLLMFLTMTVNAGVSRSFLNRLPS